MPDDILRFLKEGNDFLSGEEISRKVGISRAAVWKKIRLLQDRGYVIQAVPSKGYRLLQKPDLSAHEIVQGLNRDFWKNILLYKELGSTNEFALSLSADAEIESGTVIIADGQSGGRGRLGRRWFSPPGLNIHMSIILRPDLKPRDATLLTIVAAVSTAHALRKLTGLDMKIKWPNDIVCSDRKLCGILTEIRSDPDRITFAVIGIGINVNAAVSDLPADIRETATSLLAESGLHFSRSVVITAVLREFRKWYVNLFRRGKTNLLAQCRQLSSTLGRVVSVQIGRENISGFAEDLTDEGMLIIRLSNGKVMQISTGDISFLR